MILYLITARGGSKGVPGKNARKIGGRTLIEWKVDAVKPLLKPEDRLIISTDSEEIASIAWDTGVVEVPFERPAELATDTASSASVIAHALKECPGFKHVMLLEPSAPFTTTDTYNKAIGIAYGNDADLVVGMKQTEPNTAFIGPVRADKSVTPIIVNMQRHGRHLRRQDLPDEWTMAGNLYFFKTDMFTKTGDIYGGDRNYGVITDRWEGLEIDTMEDFELAEYAYARGYVK